MIKALIPMSLLAAAITHAELQPVEDSVLQNVNGQGGVYLSGEFAINKDGGPLWGATAGQLDENGQVKDVRNCGTAAAPEECGLRFAIKFNGNSEGWYVIDDLSGGFAFEGLTLRTEFRPTATNYDAVATAANGTQYYTTDTNAAFNKEIVEIGLPGRVSFNNFKFTYAVANNGEWGTDPTIGGQTIQYEQTDIFGIRIDGNVTLEGNLLLFPVD